MACSTSTAAPYGVTDALPGVRPCIVDKEGGMLVAISGWLWIIIVIVIVLILVGALGRGRRR
jgi:hypothetical protein